MTSNQIETLIQAGKWKLARSAIEKRLVKEPDNHWLWSRLSAVKYEQRDYAGALAEAEKALEIVPDCPLALWDYAGALDMLGRPKDALAVYEDLLHRGVQELKTPDEDADECWEGRDWTIGLMMDCFFRVAGCKAIEGKRSTAERCYKWFIGLWDRGARGIYTREDALAKLKELKKPVPDRANLGAVMKAINGAIEKKELEKVER